MQPAVGEKIYLQEDRNDSPKVRTFYEVIMERNKIIEAEKQREIKRRAGADKAIIEQRYRLQIEELKAKNKEDEIKLADMAYRIQKMKEEQEKFLKNREERKKEIERLEKQKTVDTVKTMPDTARTDGSQYTPTTRINPKTGTVYHIVSKGETLFSISKKYGVKMDKIKADNNLVDNALNLGQELVIDKE